MSPALLTPTPSLSSARNSSFQASNTLRVIEDIALAPELAQALPSNGGDKHKHAVTIVLISVGAAVTAAVLASLATCVGCALTCHRKKKKKKDKDEKIAVRGRGAVKVATTAPVVVLKRPLADLEAAT